jgi:hypothetical protein
MTGYFDYINQEVSMRRGISIALVIFGLAMLVSGLQKLFPPANDIFYRPHVVMACIFAVLVCVHLGLNRKSIARHFKGLGRWWLLVGLGFAAVIVVGIIPLFI